MVFKSNMTQEDWDNNDREYLDNLIRQRHLLKESIADKEREIERLDKLIETYNRHLG